MRWITIAALLLAPALEGAANLQGPETALDTRRRLLLEKLDNSPLYPEDPAYPTPNLRLKYGYSEEDYQERILATLGLVDMGVEPATRIAEVNKLLRYEMLGKWPAATPDSLIGQYASAWGHRAHSLGMRIYLLYSGWLDPDIKQECLKRFQWLLVEPYNQSSENIKFNNNNAVFLSHEILGQTNLATYQSIRQWWIQNLRTFGKDGASEWGTTYNGWTIGAVLNLAEFAQDPTVKKLATMCVDYWLARMSGFQINKALCSGAVRRYGHWLFANVSPQTQIAHVLFGGTSANWADWGASNYKPLTVHASLYNNTSPLEARLSERQWRHYNYRGAKYSIATQQNFTSDYYGGGSGTHDIVSCFVQSAKGDPNQVIPYGLPFGVDTKWRSTVERGWGHKNIGFVNTGGYCKRTWTGGQQHNVPVRLFYQKDFSVEIAGNWAFLTDGVIYVAWAPTIGDPIIDPDSAQLSNPTKTGSWLRSNAVATDAGETSVTEAGDSASFGSYENFKADIQARNPNPTFSNNQVVYTAKDGAALVFGLNFATANGQPADLDAWPRAQMPGVNGFSVSGITFNFDTATTSGTLTRVPANMVFGVTGPLPLAITTPATLPAATQYSTYSPLVLGATGGTPPYVSWTLIWGVLPPGMSLTATGVLNGTPSASGTFSFRIRVTDSAGAIKSRLFGLTVNPAPLLAITTPASLPNGKKTVAYSKTLTSTGGTGVYTNWILIWGVMPPGLGLSGNKIVGTPTAVGTWSYRIRVIDSSGNVKSRLFSHTVNP